MDKILTLAIPTYNRSEGLKILLLNLKKIISKYDLQKIEILISDNSSDHKTLSMIDNISNESEFSIRYIRNNSHFKKINKFSSFDSNIFNIFDHAKGKYVWLLADDDFLYEGSMGYVLGIIENNKKDFINIYVDSLKPHTNLHKDIITKNKNDFFRITKFRSGGISANIFNREIWKKNMNVKMIGSGWIHQIFLINNLGLGHSFISKKSLKNEFINENFNKYKKIFKKNLNSNEYFLANLNIMKLIQEMSNLGYDKSIVKLGLDILQKNYLYKLISYKIGGIEKNTSVFKQFLSANKNLYFRKYFYLCVLFLMPDFIFKLLKKLLYLKKI